MILWPPPGLSGFVRGRGRSCVALRGGLAPDVRRVGLVFCCRSAGLGGEGRAVQCRRPRVSGGADPACRRDREACGVACRLGVSWAIDLSFQYYV